VLCLWQALYPSLAMRARLLQWLADRSFSIYLLHPIALELVRQGYQVLTKHGLPDTDAFYATSLAGALCFLFAAAECTYRYVELPGIAAGRRIAARLNTAGKASAGSPASLEPQSRKVG
jgi:peptidoglycan/LPS O-acetylase OafA/YrhL